MREVANIEVAHKLIESGPAPRSALSMELIEIAEAIILSLIAVATAFSGYQAAKWDGHQGFLYGTSARLRVEASLAATEGGQRRLLDVTTFNTWIRVKEETNNKHLAGLYVRRFSPEYRIAFDAWLKTEPFTRRDAPPGPIFMPEYHNALIEKSAKLNEEATTAFKDGTEARVISEKYVRSSVLLAVVIFLIALAQRFKIRKVRVGLLLVATAVMIYSLGNLSTYPRLRGDSSQTDLRE